MTTTAAADRRRYLPQDMLTDLETARLELNLESDRYKEATLRAGGLAKQLEAAQAEAQVMRRRISELEQEREAAGVRLSQLLANKAMSDLHRRQLEHRVSLNSLADAAAAPSAALAADAPTADADAAAAAAATAEGSSSSNAVLGLQQDLAAERAKTTQLERTLNNLHLELARARNEATAATRQTTQLQDMVIQLERRLQDRDAQVKKSNQWLSRASSDLRRSFAGHVPAVAEAEAALRATPLQQQQQQSTDGRSTAGGAAALTNSDGRSESGRSNATQPLNSAAAASPHANQNAVRRYDPRATDDDDGSVAGDKVHLLGSPSAGMGSPASRALNRLLPRNGVPRNAAGSPSAGVSATGASSQPPQPPLLPPPQQTDLVQAVSRDARGGSLDEPPTPARNEIPDELLPLTRAKRSSAGSSSDGSGPSSSAAAWDSASSVIASGAAPALVLPTPTFAAVAAAVAAEEGTSPGLSLAELRRNLANSPSVSLVLRNSAANAALVAAAAAHGSGGGLDPINESPRPSDGGADARVAADQRSRLRLSPARVNSWRTLVAGSVASSDREPSFRADLPQLDGGLRQQEPRQHGNNNTAVPAAAAFGDRTATSIVVDGSLSGSMTFWRKGPLPAVLPADGSVALTVAFASAGSNGSISSSADGFVGVINSSSGSGSQERAMTGTSLSLPLPSPPEVGDSSQLFLAADMQLAQGSGRERGTTRLPRLLTTLVLPCGAVALGAFVLLSRVLPVRRQRRPQCGSPCASCTPNGIKILRHVQQQR